MRNLFILTLFVIAFQFSIADSKKEITVENARIKAVPSASQNTGGFMVLKNSSTKDVSLVKAESDISNSVELHTMMMVDGVMKMRPVEKIEIKANSSVELKPGSFHVMFIGLKAPLKVEEKKNLTLTFSNGQKENLSIPVKELNMK
ncbi:MAG TPA: copper chaperone PCu(A)C [Leptospiraceae bacterium]|nr:copper chaperone PCu(A)C [Leptospiraceae bacterium]HRG74076.1 copper chaperone PCu(A)C [Leptospiraceae bacterium]